MNKFERFFDIVTNHKNTFRIGEFSYDKERFHLELLKLAKMENTLDEQAVFDAIWEKGYGVMLPFIASQFFEHFQIDTKKVVFYKKLI